jgi:hypothetical protein
MLSVTYKPFMPSVVMLSAVMVCAVMLRVIRLSVMAPWNIYYLSPS